MNMQPTLAELEAAQREEDEALAQFVDIASAVVGAELKLQAARKRLSLARSNKWALTNDLMAYA